MSKEATKAVWYTVKFVEIDAGLHFTKFKRRKRLDFGDTVY